MKKKVLFVYPSMILGGSTTSLLSFLNLLDPEEYDIDLLLQSNSGPLFGDIPSHVNVLPQGHKYTGRKGQIIKGLKFVFCGAVFKAFFANLKNKKIGLSPDVMYDFWAKSLSRRVTDRYDYAIGFLEGWSNSYIAHCVHAAKKYAWLHSTFEKITDDPKSQLPWMRKVDKIVFVADDCVDAFKKTLPEMASKTIALQNLTDSEIVRRRSEHADLQDEAYKRFAESHDFKLITVCRLMKDVKGLDRIVSCAKALKEKGISFLWYIVGSGPDEVWLHEAIAQADVQDCLVPVGARYNPFPMICEADIMCMPSRYEGKPMVITESMILGVPPVVTEYLSAKEQINDGVDGIVAKNEDSAIIDAVLSCIEEPSRVSKMKQYLFEHEYGNKDYIKTIEKELFE